MIDDIKYIYSNEMVDSMQKLISIFKTSNMTSEQIADHLISLDFQFRDYIYMIAVIDGEHETAKRISEAFQLMEERKINNFKEVVKLGTEKEFLDKMSWLDKSALKVHIQLSKELNKEPFTKEDLKYLEIIEKSINEDIKKEVLSKGFNSIEEWQNYNSSIVEKSKIRSRIYDPDIVFN